MCIYDVLIAAVMIGLCVYAILRSLMKLDKMHGMVFSRKEWCLLLAGSLVMAGIWGEMALKQSMSVKMAWLLIHIYFLSCSMVDSMTCHVYDIFQIPGITAAGYLVLKQQSNVLIGISILIFTILQSGIFMRLYGDADGMALMVAAMAEGALGYDINVYLLHMIMAYLLLAVVQIYKRNVGGRGRLKRPVPFLPYITVSFLAVLIFGEI